MLTDFYQLSMAYAYWKHGRHEQASSFELFFRKNPFNGEFTVFAGLEEVLRFIEHLSFSAEDIRYIRELLPEAEDGFFEWLGSIDGSCLVVFAVKEGTVVFPVEPLVRIEGPLAVAQLVETPVLNLVNYASLVCTNAARFRLTVGKDKKLFEFGVRRAQGPDGALSASRYAYVGGFDGTSNVLAGQVLGIPVSGTHSHAFVQSYGGLDDLPDDTKVGDVDIKEAALHWRRVLGYDDHRVHDGELAAFVAYALAFPRGFVALVDTYSTLETGLKNFVCVALALADAGFQALGVRIDSGDLAYLSRQARLLFDTLAADHQAPCLKAVKIVASNDINESVLLSLKEQNHAVDVFGIGTHLVTCQAQPALGCVYKLVEIDNRPCIKLSNDIHKTTIPGAKTPFRLVSRDGVMLLDLLVPARHAPPQVGDRVLCRHPFNHQKRVYVTPSAVVPLLDRVFDGSSLRAATNGRRHASSLSEPLAERPSLDQIKAHVDRQIAHVRGDILRPLNPTPYKVSLTPELYAFFIDIWHRNEPVRELE